jgi:FG-GAP-like repeat
VRASALTPPLLNDPVVFCTLTGCPYTNPHGLDAADIWSGEGFVPDGYPEIVVTNGFPPNGVSVSVFRNKANWTVPAAGLALPTEYLLACDRKPYDVQFADMDHYGGPPDGLLDIVVSQFGASESCVTILYNKGPLGFSPPAEQTVITLEDFNARGLTVADLNADGLQDIAVSGATGSRFGGEGQPELRILWRTLTDVFVSESIKVNDIAPVGVGTGTEVIAAAIQQPQVGGRLDVLMSMIIGNPSGTNPPRVLRLKYDPNVPPTGQPNVWDKVLVDAVNSHGIDFDRLRPGVPRDATLADYDSPSSDSVRILKGDGTGFLQMLLFPDVYPLGSGSSPRAVAIGKLNADNRNDAVYVCESGGPNGNGCVVLHFGKAPDALGDPKFDTVLGPQVFPVLPSGAGPGGSQFVILADMNDDGGLDVVTSNFSHHSISVLLRHLNTTQ